MSKCDFKDLENVLVKKSQAQNADSNVSDFENW